MVTPAPETPEEAALEAACDVWFCFSDHKSKSSYRGIKAKLKAVIEAYNAKMAEQGYKTFPPHPKLEEWEEWVTMEANFRG